MALAVLAAVLCTALRDIRREVDIALSISCVRVTNDPFIDGAERMMLKVDG